MRVKKQQLELDMEQLTGTKLRKEYDKGVYCNVYVEYIMLNAELDEAQTGIRITRRNINSLRYADDTALMCRKQRRTKEPLEGERGE